MKTSYQTLILIVLFITSIPFIVGGNTNDSSFENVNHAEYINHDIVLPDQTHENPGVFKLVNFNIIGAQNTPGNNWSEILVDENAEVLTLTETGRWKLSDGSFDIAVAELNALFPDETPYEGVTFEPVGTTDGQAVLSRYPIKSSYSVPEFPLDDGTMYQLSHPLMVAVLDIDGQDILVATEHNSCCLELVEARSNEQEAINNFFDSLGPNVKIIYAGDLNNAHPETLIVDPEKLQGTNSDNIEMLLNSSHPQATKQHTWVDTYRELNPDFHQYPGYSNEDNNGFLERLDYTMVNQNLFDTLVSSRMKLRDFDHGHLTNIFNLNPNEVNLRPPSPPTGIITNVDVANQQTTISWDENTEDDFYKYQLWRNQCLITEIPKGQTSFDDDYFYNTNTIYNYELRAVDSIENISPLSAYNYINTSLGSLSLPGVPDITISTVSGGIRLTWVEPDTGNTPIIQYEVKRNSRFNDLTQPFVFVSSENYTDSSISRAGITIYYQVRAINLVGTGPLSILQTGVSGFMSLNALETFETNSKITHNSYMSPNEECPATITTLEYTPPPITTSTPSTTTSTIATSTITSSDTSESNEGDSVFGLPIFSFVLLNLAVIILRKRKH